jgi:hypothetical protein
MPAFIPLGTGEHNYVLPPVPSSQDDVLFAKLKKANQYWRRQDDLPEVFYKYNWYTRLDAPTTRYGSGGNLIAMSESDTKIFKRFQTRELRRRKNGIWMMNDGELTHLVGSHYFMLQWGAMPDVYNDDGEPYGEYREFQRDVHYFLDLCKRDDYCSGGYIQKPKKTGITQLLALDYLDESTRIRNKRFGIMSKTQLDARDTNFNFYNFGLKHLPMALRPQVDADTKTRLHYGIPEKKNTGTERAMMAIADQEMGLNTEVVCLPTKPAAFDGPKWFRIWLDEFPKYTSPANPEIVWEKSSETIKMQEEQVGKAWITAYPPEDDSPAFLEARKIYFDSKIHTRNKETGRTVSELYTHYISVLDAAEGSFDKNGRTDRKKTKVYMDARRAQLANDPVKLQSHIRRNSETEEESWRSGGGGGTPFDNTRLSIQQLALQEGARAGVREYLEGYLQWTGERLESEVEFVPLTEKDILAGATSKFRLWRPDWLDAGSFNLPVKLNLRDKMGRLKPHENTLYVGATDPVDYVNKSDVIAGSNNAITAHIMPDVGLNSRFGQNVTDRLMLDYLMRTEDPDEYYEDLVMSMLWLGMYVAPEFNKPWVVKKLKDDGLQNFLLMRTKERSMEPYNSARKQFYISTQRSGGVDVIDEIIRAINVRLRRPQTPNEFDRLTMVRSERLLEGLMRFTPTDTKRFDEVMCYGHNVLALDALINIRAAAAKKQPRPEDAEHKMMVRALKKLAHI